MQVRPRRAAGRAYFANNVASFHHIALLAVELIHMAVHSDQALPVIDKNTISVEKKVAGQNNFTIRRGNDISTSRRGNIKTTVWSASLFIKESL